MLERKDLPNDGGSWFCKEIVKADSGLRHFGWQQCGNQATHISWDSASQSGQPKCFVHDDFPED